MAGDEPRSGPGDYHGARIVAAATLAGVTAFLLTYDALSESYEVNVVILGFLLTSILACLAVDIPGVLRK